MLPADAGAHGGRWDYLLVVQPDGTFSETVPPTTTHPPGGA
jgi:hypothetical protein